MYSHYTPEKFESEWKRVVDCYGASHIKWIDDTYELKRMWASAYMRDHLLCGVRTTSICEGVNSFIKKYVQHKNSLVDFLHNFERALKEYRHNELMFDFISFYYQPVLTTALSGFELGASKVLTHKKFKDVKKAIEDVATLSITERREIGDNVIFRVNVYRNKDVVFWVHLDKLKTKFLCDCRRFERRGLPCSHIICCMKYDDMKVFPESLICKRWKKSAKNDHISSFAFQEGDSDKMFMFRRTVLAAAFNSLSNISCKSANDYKEVVEGICSLCDKINRRREGNGNGNGEHKAKESAVHDPLMVKTKGAPRKQKFKKKKCCSHCRRPGHTIRKCPTLAGVDVIIEYEKEEEEEASPVESDDESKNLNVSISHDVNEDIHSVEISNPRQNVGNRIGIKRKRHALIGIKCWQ